MGTLSSELSAVLDRTPSQPRVYADANLPAGLVGFMRRDLRWDVFFVMEHEELRRARDTEHFALAARMHRTLLTLDRDYFDDKRFPPEQTAGVIVLAAPDERLLARVLRRIDRLVLRAADPDAPPDSGRRARRRAAAPVALPLRGRKLHVHLDWPPATKSRSRP